MGREVRVAELIKRKIASIIQLKMHDNRIGFVSITQVKVSKDLTSCTVFVSTFGDEKAKAKSINGLKHAEGFIKKELSKALTIKRMPQLKFVSDDSLEKGAEVIDKLRKLENEED